MKKTMLLFVSALMLGSFHVQAAEWCESYIPGDFDHDGDVDDADIAIYQNEYYGNTGSCGYPYYSLCTTMGDCLDVGGYWWDNGTCNSSADPDVKTVVSDAGQVWIDRNLGAARVATSAVDEYAFGDLYQWGRGTDGHEKRYSEVTAMYGSEVSDKDDPGHDRFILSEYAYEMDWRWPQNNELWQGVTGVNNPCPPGFRVPTWTEWEAEDFGVIGSIDDPFASPLKLTAANSRGGYEGGMDINNDEREGAYWSSTTHDTESYRVRYSDGFVTPLWTWRSNGLSVRCIQD